MKNKKILLVDCGIKRTANGPQQDNYADITMLQLAKRRGIALDRFAYYLSIRA